MTVLTTEVTEFLHAAFGDVDAAKYTLCLFAVPSRRSIRINPSTLEGAEAFVDRWRDENVYVEVGFGNLKGRSKTEYIDGIVGLWADIDVAGEGHNDKKVYAPNTEEAIAMLESLPLAPTIIVNSGHGVQSWWLFNEPWEFEGAADRADALDLSTRWVDTLRATARSRGWTLDAVHDLARLMRLPGSRNCKDPNDPGKIREDIENAPQVFILTRGDQRYNPDDFDPYLVESRAVAAAGMVEEGLVFDPNAEVSRELWGSLTENIPLFAATFNRQRSDFNNATPPRDHTGSVYDMALASLMAAAGSDDQQILDVLISSRRFAEGHAKLDSHGQIRKDYYIRTIGTARAEHGFEDLSDQIAVAHELGDDVTIDDTRSQLLANLSAQFGIAITRIVRYDGAQPIYHMWANGRDAKLGTSRDLQDQAAVCAAIQDTAFKIPPKRFKDEKWRAIINCIMAAAEVETVDAEGIDDMLAEYLDGPGRGATANVEMALQSNQTFIRDGTVYVFPRELLRWLNHHYFNNKLTLKQLSIMLRQGGYEQRQEKVGTRMKTVWGIQ